MTTLKTKRVDFLQALQIVSKAVSPKPAIPLFSNILLEVMDETAILSATDFEIGIRVILPEVKGGKFKTAVPARLLTDLFSTLQEEQVSMKYSPSTQSLLVETKSTKNNVKCVNPDDFPEIPHIEKETVKIDSVKFKIAVPRCSFCAKTDDDQSPLSGVNIIVEEGKLILLAVDGFHLAQEEIILPKKNTRKGFSAIVKASTLDMISRILEDSGNVSIEITETQVRFNTECISIVSQRMDGKFPDPKLILDIAKNVETTIKVSTLELLRACRIANLFSLAGKSYMKASGSLLQVSTVAGEKGDGKIEVLSEISGPSIEFTLNASMMKQFLEICETESAVIELSSPKKPVVFKMDDDSIKYIHIIMPIA